MDNGETDFTFFNHLWVQTTVHTWQLTSTRVSSH